MSYIYGAAVQGIQQFILQTNELKDIVGASELVEEICTTLFEEVLGKQLATDPNALINAAGNVKYHFKEKSDCEKVVRLFPKMVVEKAPGITISQAVVEFREGDNFAHAVNELEKRLRAQRNKPMASTTIGLMGIKRSNKTNSPVVKIDGDDDFLDQATINKRESAQVLTLCKTAFGEENLKHHDVAIDPEKMTAANDWVAVIHADGNGLGQIVQQIGAKRDLFKEFSQKLDQATKGAARAAYNDVKQAFKDKPTPIRPIVLGGDDFTAICRADIALPYVTSFILHFEEKTKELLGDIITGRRGGNSVFREGEVRDCLTACAGIAFVKSSYPFFYAYKLAEDLCKRAKQEAKNKESIREGREIAPSCLMFHKVQDCFVRDFKEIARRELELGDKRTFEFGPYYIKQQRVERWQVRTLLESAELIDKKGKDGNAVKSHLRNWMSLLKEGNTGMAEQKLKRMKSIVTDERLLTLINDITSGDRMPVYDILAIHTINTQKTKEDEK